MTISCDRCISHGVPAPAYVFYKIVIHPHAFVAEICTPVEYAARCIQHQIAMSDSSMQSLEIVTEDEYLVQAILSS